MHEIILLCMKLYRPWKCSHGLFTFNFDGSLHVISQAGSQNAKSIKDGTLAKYFTAKFIISLFGWTVSTLADIGLCPQHIDENMSFRTRLI